jgi:hypothetical protein
VVDAGPSSKVSADKQQQESGGSSSAGARGKGGEGKVKDDKREEVKRLIGHEVSKRLSVKRKTVSDDFLVDKEVSVASFVSVSRIVRCCDGVDGEGDDGTVTWS